MNDSKPALRARSKQGQSGLMLRLRPVLALALLAILAGCASQTTSAPGQASRGQVHRGARSYDPPGPPSDPWGPWINEAANRFDVPERWVREVMRQESGGRTNAMSPVGAMGLMQLMPGTYAEMRNRYGLGEDPYHPYDNLMAGTAYLREMYDLYGTPAFLAAYNAGPRRLEDYLFNSRGLPNETRNYVARIGPRIDGHHPQRRVPLEIAQAAEIPHNIPPGPRRMDRRMIAQLREQRLAAQPGIQLAAAPQGEVMRMDPIPDGSTPEGASRLAGLREPTLEPLPLPSEGAPDGRQTPRLASLLGISSARAATPLPRPLAAGAPATGQWSVQVGAFSSENLARSAANHAREVAASNGRVLVQPVPQGRTTLFRARVTGLSQQAAQGACEKLRGRGGCSVVAPGV